MIDRRPDPEAEFPRARVLVPASDNPDEGVAIGLHYAVYRELLLDRRRLICCRKAPVSQ